MILYGITAVAWTMRRQSGIGPHVGELCSRQRGNNRRAGMRKIDNQQRYGIDLTIGWTQAEIENLLSKQKQLLLKLTVQFSGRAPRYIPQN